MPNVYSLLDPILYSSLIKNKTYKNVENNVVGKKCSYISTPQPEDKNIINGQLIVWNCPAGYFCPNFNSSFKCTPGFFCPKNSAQPSYCCEGFYCSKDTKNITLCPQGHFCTVGTVTPTSCDFLAICPSGSVKANKIFAYALGLLFTTEKPGHVISYGCLDPISETFDIEFENIGLGIRGNFQHGRACAIMGPSGAGKTTLISILTGKVKKTSGKVKVNGVEEPLEKYRKLIGFVPQEDVMLRELTVLETLMHSAQMRLPVNMDRTAKKQKVIETIKFLKLDHVMHSKIGDEERRGISGGQRKRVNIGIELVTEPSILFLDEPTSGLDSVTALEVCTMLKNVAKNRKLTVVAIIHSPSPQVFKTFDDLLLLDSRGGLVYFGKTNKAKNYFESLGYNFPDEKEESLADFIMKIASGNVKPIRRMSYPHQRYTFHPGLVSIDVSENELLESKHKPKKLEIIFQIVEDIRIYINEVILELSMFLKCSLLFWKHDPIRDTPNTLCAFLLLIKRAYLQVYKSSTQFLSDQIMHLFCGTFSSLAISTSEFKGKPPNEICEIAPYVLKATCVVPLDRVKTIGMFITVGITFAAASAGTSTFGFEKAVYWRDVSSGMNTIPYFLAKLINDFPRIIIAAIMFSLSLFVFYPFEAKLYEIYVIVLSNYFTSWIMGYFISILVRKEKFGLVCTVFALAWGLVFSGGSLTLDDIKSNNSYKPLEWLWEISAQRWVAEAIYLRDLAPRSWNEIKDEKLKYTYSFDDYPICFFYIFCIALGWALLALFALKLMHRDKQK
ncbi:10169_t:CDS:10 [Dentiscutata erythropus]|uniref:10169_t:CDS:1 n=1 Tax=Dentiscutata erythropus TaxID=1348616 RepID=A0A9N9A7U3_9GLOM|nr:10169_t:CDS:10 [Dentiscutata erythropus]